MRPWMSDTASVLVGITVEQLIANRLPKRVAPPP